MNMHIDRDFNERSDHPAEVHVLVQTDLEQAPEAIFEGQYAVIITGDDKKTNCHLIGATNEVSAVGILAGLNTLRKIIAECHPMAAAINLLEMAKESGDTGIESVVRKIMDQMEEDASNE